MFNLELRTWDAVLTKSDEEEYPSHRRCHGCVQRGNIVYIVGGTDGTEICGDLWKFDLDILQWTKIRVDMPVPVYFHGTAMSPAGQMVIFGGVNSTPQNSRNNNLFSIWLTKPPLKELAWQALNSYCNNDVLTKSSEEELVMFGIPISCVQRLKDRETSGTQPALPY